MPDQFKALIINQEGDSFKREVKSVEINFNRDGNWNINSWW